MSEPGAHAAVDPRRVLLFTHVVPYPPGAGNEQRIDRLLRWLQSARYEVVLLLTEARLTPEQDAVLRARVYRLHVLPEGLPQRAMRRLANLSMRDAHPAERWMCPRRVQRAVARLAAVYRPAVVIAEYPFMSRALVGLPPQVLRVIDCHDMFSQRHDKVVSRGVRDPLACTPAQEAQMLRRADVILAIQDEERAALAALVPDREVLSIGVDQEVRAAGAPEIADPDSVLCVASDNPANRKGIRTFLAEAWPRIRAAHPRAHLDLYGRITQRFADEPPIPGVRLHGFAPDLAAAYARAAVVVNPVRAGTGLKIKSVEALAHGRPLVSLDNGVEGMGPHAELPARVARDLDELSGHVCALLADADARVALAARARAFAEQRYARDAVYGPLADVLLRHLRTIAAEAPPAPLRVLALLARHGTKKYPHALAELQAFYARVLYPGRDSYRIVVLENDNSVAQGESDTAHVAFLRGDNGAFEFSAWEVGLRACTEDGSLAGADLVHFVTDAFGVPYSGYLQHISRAQLALCARETFALGHLDAYPRPITLQGQRSQSWLRTCFFFLSPRALERLGGSLVSIDPAAFFTDDPDAPFRPDAPLSARYRRYVTDWLNGPGLGHGAWHSRFVRTRETMPYFRQKARAILHEHALSIRLRAAGVPTVDAAWLWLELRRRPARDADLTAPPGVQVAARTRLLRQGQDRPARGGLARLRRLASAGLRRLGVDADAG